MARTVNLKSIPYGNAKVIINSGNIKLISYVTTVAEIQDDWLTIYGLYSMTTRKHISAFVKEYCGITYQTAKKIYEDGLKYNLATGEVVEIEGA